MPSLKRQLPAKGIHFNAGKTVALTPKRHVPTPETLSFVAGVAVGIADKEEIKVVGVPVGTDEIATANVAGIVRDTRAKLLAQLLPRMPIKQAPNPIATGSMVQRTAYVEWVIAPRMSLLVWSFLERRNNRRSSRRVERRACPRGPEGSQCRWQRRAGCPHQKKYIGDNATHSPD